MGGEPPEFHVNHDEPSFFDQSKEVVLDTEGRDGACFRRHSTNPNSTKHGLNKKQIADRSAKIKNSFQARTSMDSFAYKGVDSMSSSVM